LHAGGRRFESDYLHQLQVSVRERPLFSMADSWPFHPEMNVSGDLPAPSRPLVRTLRADSAKSQDAKGVASSESRGQSPGPARAAPTDHANVHVASAEGAITLAEDESGRWEERSLLPRLGSSTPKRK
jgi:hypothetical protein